MTNKGKKLEKKDTNIVILVVQWRQAESEEKAKKAGLWGAVCTTKRTRIK